MDEKPMFRLIDFKKSTSEQIGAQLDLRSLPRRLRYLPVRRRREEGLYPASPKGWRFELRGVISLIHAEGSPSVCALGRVGRCGHAITPGPGR